MNYKSVMWINAKTENFNHTEVNIFHRIVCFLNGEKAQDLIIRHLKLGADN